MKRPEGKDAGKGEKRASRGGEGKGRERGRERGRTVLGDDKGKHSALLNAANFGHSIIFPTQASLVLAGRVHSTARSAQLKKAVHSGTQPKKSGPHWESNPGHLQFVLRPKQVSYLWTIRPCECGLHHLSSAQSRWLTRITSNP